MRLVSLSQILPYTVSLFQSASKRVQETFSHQDLPQTLSSLAKATLIEGVKIGSIGGAVGLLTAFPICQLSESCSPIRSAQISTLFYSVMGVSCGATQTLTRYSTGPQSPFRDINPRLKKILFRIGGYTTITAAACDIVRRVTQLTTTGTGSLIPLALLMGTGTGCFSGLCLGTMDRHRLQN